MNHKKYYDMNINQIPYINKSDLVPGTILAGTRRTFSVYCFQKILNENGYSVSLFNSDTDLAVIISVIKKNSIGYSYNVIEKHDLILLNTRQKILFTCHSDSGLFVKFGSP